MKSVQFKLKALFLLILISLATLFYFSFFHDRVLENQSQTVHALKEKKDLVIKLKGLQINNENFHQTIEYLRQKTLSSNHRPHVARITQAYTARNERVLEERLNQYENLLKEELRSLSPPWYATIEMESVLLSVIGALAFASLLMVAIIRQRIFRPLEKLQNQMKNFLYERYHPEIDHASIGGLEEIQQQFHAVAQRMININDELKNLNQAKSEFLNMVSHELRTPMTSIKGSLSILAHQAMGPIDPSSLRLIQIANQETDRLIRLINDLLDLGKLEARKLPLNKEEHLWNDLIGKTVDSLWGLAQEKSITIEYQSIEGLKLNVDSDRIQQVITNLLSNAIKFSPENSKILINLSISSEDFLQIGVTDEGPGLSPEELKHLFQKFHQNRQSSLVKGTGLGLAISKALVEEHGGSMWVESVLNEGCSFYFTLPNWSQPAEEESVA